MSSDLVRADANHLPLNSIKHPPTNECPRNMQYGSHIISRSIFLGTGIDCKVGRYY